MAVEGKGRGAPGQDPPRFVGRQAKQRQAGPGLWTGDDDEQRQAGDQQRRQASARAGRRRPCRHTFVNLYQSMRSAASTSSGGRNCGAVGRAESGVL